MIHNQFLVPGKAVTTFEAYLQNRSGLMQQIEQEDVRQLESANANDKTR